MSGVSLRFRGALSRLDPPARRALTDRVVEGADEIRGAVTRIVADVRARGDAALIELARELDGVALERLEVPTAEWQAALDAAPRELVRALERAIRNLEATHGAWRPRGGAVETEPGVLVGRRADPIGRVGVYVPGGRAAYPSSVLMAAVPARVVGVGEIVVCSPPDRSGRPPALVLAAARLAGVDRLFAVGGAGAVAAMAYGTESVPRVDRIVGPGNAYVMEAKLQVATRVAIDAPAGPSEILIVADDATRPELIAREMVAQAEHDPRAASVAVIVGKASALEPIERALAEAVAGAERRDVVEASLGAAGGLLLAADLDEAVGFANEYGAEHLLVALRDAYRLRDRFRVAGSIFLGPASSVAFGDYLTGGNHVLPTGGLARAYSGLAPEDFVRWTTYQQVTPRAAARLAEDVAALARAERLPGHALAALGAGSDTLDGRSSDDA
ncbi:MAG: histidinol dehydrogenase [Gemmatimonadales bacterium]